MQPLFSDAIRCPSPPATQRGTLSHPSHLNPHQVPAAKTQTTPPRTQKFSPDSPNQPIKRSPYHHRTIRKILLLDNYILLIRHPRSISNRPDGVVGYHVSLTRIRSPVRARVWSLLLLFWSSSFFICMRVDF
jgi:hypothetical protein